MAFFLSRVGEKSIDKSLVVIDGISELFNVEVQSVAFFYTGTWVPGLSLGIGTCESIAQTPATFGSLSVALKDQLLFGLLVLDSPWISSPGTFGKPVPRVFA